MTAPHLRAIAYYLPDNLRTNEDLVALNPTWNADDIFKSTGVKHRHIAPKGVIASDMALMAGEKLLNESGFDRTKIDALLYSAQQGDYFCPATCCILQDKLGLPTSCAAVDYKHGCSAFNYGLWLARSLILSGSAENVLILIGDCATSTCNLHDKTTVTLFSDGAAAALVTKDSVGAIARLGHCLMGTDGRGAHHLIVPAGGARRAKDEETALEKLDESGNLRSLENTYMNGAEIFNFTLTTVVDEMNRFFQQMEMKPDQIDMFLMHQANSFILQTLRRKMKIPAERMPIDMEEVGNVTSASLPVHVRRCLDKGLLRSGMKTVFAGFGVGYSWGFTYAEIL